MVTLCLGFALSTGKGVSLRRGFLQTYCSMFNGHSLPSSGPICISDLTNPLLPHILLTIPARLCHRDLSILGKPHHMKNVIDADFLHSGDNIHFGVGDKAFLSVLKSAAEFRSFRGSIHSDDRTLSSFDPGDDMESLLIGQRGFAKFVLETPWA